MTDLIDTDYSMLFVTVPGESLMECVENATQHGRRFFGEDANLHVVLTEATVAENLKEGNGYVVSSTFNAQASIMRLQEDEDAND